MRCRALIVAVGQILLVGIAHAQGPLHAVLISHRVTNTTTQPAQSVTAICILPATNRYQEVVDLQIDPKPVATRDDAERQKVITVELGDIPPGETRAVRVLAWARVKPINLNLLGPPLKVTTLPADIEAGQLTDGFLLQLAKVRPIADKNAGKSTRDLDRARALYEFLTREASYDIDEKFETADKILAGAPASCSELAYTYVALCRAEGIPARIVSAYVNREGTSPSTDWRTHRWVEFYTKDFGWVPADPTNRMNEPSKTFFGKQDGKYLTVIDDGVPFQDTPDPAWEVFIAGSKAAPETPLELSRSAVWRVSANRMREIQLFQTACAALRSSDLKVRSVAVTEWTRGRDVASLGYVLEALFDPDIQIRKDSAGAIGRSGDVSMLIPLALLASREKDEKLKDALLAAARQLLSTPTEAKRAQAVTELAKARTPEAMQLLDGIWRDESREVRKAAAQSFYKFGNKPMVHEAYRILTADADEYIRAVATIRWARTPSREPEPLLVDMLESEVRWDREQALKELAKRGDNKFGFDPTIEPKLRSNQEAITKWRDWLASRTVTATQATAP